MIDYKNTLNNAQYEAVTSNAEAMLVIAGAGSGKTRVIVHRLAWLVEQGISPESILLLTFTRKAARQMIDRAQILLNSDFDNLQGGTFHSLAYSILRKTPPEWLKGHSFTLMDASDITQAINHCRERLKVNKKDLPKTPAIVSILSKARNKELLISDVLRQESFHMLPYADVLTELNTAYDNYRKENALLDYDDLLFELEGLLKNGGSPADVIRNQFSHILVDEYQDTNLVQGRITRLLAGDAAALKSRVMAVGDEAQSIYAFRGANVRNILNFQKLFPNTQLVRLEENYRSTQPILDVANGILAHAKDSFNKKLYTEKKGGIKPKMITPLSDGNQARIVVNRVQELLNTYSPQEIAVLFRAGYHSYPVENLLRIAKIPFQKFGGVRLVEASHIKDILSFARVALNPLDFPAFSRLANMCKGIGPKTAANIYELLAKHDDEGLRKKLKKHEEFFKDLVFIDKLRRESPAPGDFLEQLIDWYRPRLECLYPEDWPGRMQGLEEILQIAYGYTDLDLFVADLALEAPEGEGMGESEPSRDSITLSTIHSAKGLEWKAVLMIDLVEDRFPSHHAQVRQEDFEEERRLFYVGCTRAKEILELYSPAAVYSRKEGCHIGVNRSPFLLEVEQAGENLLDSFMENYAGVLIARRPPKPKFSQPAPVLTPTEPVINKNPDESTAGQMAGLVNDQYCKHKIFGRGKILKIVDDEKVLVNFPGYGIKTILTRYLQIISPEQANN